MGFFRSTRLTKAPAQLMVSLLAVLALFGQLGGAVHLAVVQHVACPEHGELVEVDQDLQHHDRARSSTPTHAVVLADHAEAHGHDHCVIAIARRDRVRHAPNQLSIVPREGADQWVSACGFVLPPPAISLLFLAPKNSPPV
jgi:hypothetical protein